MIRTHKSLVIIYLAFALLMTHWMKIALFEVSFPSYHYLPHLIIGSVYVRILVSLCMGNSNYLYRAAAVCTFVCSQWWIFVHLPMVSLSWLPILLGVLLIKLMKNRVLTVLIVERDFFWCEFISLWQISLVVLCLVWN